MSNGKNISWLQFSSRRIAIAFAEPQGFHNKAFQYFCYAFYPAHMSLLFIVREWVLR